MAKNSNLTENQIFEIIDNNKKDFSKKQIKFFKRYGRNLKGNQNINQNFNDNNNHNSKSIEQQNKSKNNENISNPK